MNQLRKLHSLHGGRGILCFAIDECHCISSWGHDFRPSYRSLSNIRREFPNIPVMALTATATAQVTKDVVDSLSLRNPLVTKGTFNRPNIYYRVEIKKDTPEDDFRVIFGAGMTGNHIPKDKQAQLRRRKLDQYAPAIVYCTTRKETEDIAHMLRVTFKLRCAAYVKSDLFCLCFAFVFLPVYFSDVAVVSEYASAHSQSKQTRN